MQVDFHHTVVYVLSRLAKFSEEDSDIISYSSQYIDDATTSGKIEFDNGATYERESPSHRMLDYRNSIEMMNSRSWLPFHFIPGNKNKKPNERVSGKFINKLISIKDSIVVKEAIDISLSNKDKYYSLHLLGVVSHVYVDTFTHYGFSGVMHRSNECSSIKILNSNKLRLKLWYRNIASYFAAKFCPLGHGTVLSYPDIPWLNWSYKNNEGKVIERNNLENFIEASEKLFSILVSHKKRLKSIRDYEIPEEDKKVIIRLLSTKIEDSKDRHKLWIEAIKDGEFSFGKEYVEYSPDEKKWKNEILRVNKEDSYIYTQEFLSSNWKLFHDAVKFYRISVINDVFPKYGICIS